MQGLFFAGLLVGAGWGAWLGSRTLLVLLGGQLALYALGALGWAFPGVARWRPARLAAHFDMIVLASFTCLLLWTTGRVRATWEPTRSRSRGS